MNDFACKYLSGKTINGWSIGNVVNRFGSLEYKQGERCTIDYEVSCDSTTAYMSVLDYERLHTIKLPDFVKRSEYIAMATSSFSYEGTLSQYCTKRHITNVVKVLDFGDFEIDGFLIPTVSYIIYEIKNKDVLKSMEFVKKVSFSASVKTLAEKLKSLHGVTVGLKQLHQNNITHQNICPINIQIDKDASKISNLANAVCFDPELGFPIGYKSYNGDWSYAPPEAFFAVKQNEEKETMFQIDNYMLGSLVVFYLTGVSLNSLIDYYLGKSVYNLACENRLFESVLPDILNAYDKSLQIIKGSIPLKDLQDDIMLLIESLTFPDPKRRGHPKTLKLLTPNYDLQRTITQLNVFYKKAEYALLNN